MFCHDNPLPHKFVGDGTFGPLEDGTTIPKIIVRCRRQFLKSTAVGAGVLASGMTQPARAVQAPALGRSKPNFLFLLCSMYNFRLRLLL